MPKLAAVLPNELANDEPILPMNPLVLVFGLGGFSGRAVPFVMVEGGGPEGPASGCGRGGFN